MIARSSDTSQSEPLPAGLVWGSGLGLLALCAFLSWPLLVQTLLPNSDWDSALYHLPLAERYLAGALWSSDPLFSAHSFPGAISLVYAAFIGVGFESAIIPYNFLGVLVTLVAVAAMAARLADARAARWGVVVCATTHIVWQLGVDPRVDAFLCIFVMGAVLALAIFAENRTQSTPLFLIAISLNAAMGSKYTGLFIGFAVVGVTAVAIVGEHLRRGRGPTASAIALALLLLIVPNGAWYASNLAFHGDPLFPMLRGDYYESPERPGERIPTKGALTAQIDASAADSEQRRFIDSLQQRYQTETSPRHLFDLYDMHRNPDAYAVKPNHFGSPLLLLFLALPFALGRDSRKRAGGLTVYLVALGCYLALGSQANLLRYVLPILPIFAAGSGVVIARFPNRVWQAACLGLVLVLLVQHRAAETAKLENLHPGAWVETRLDRIEWLKHAGYNFTTAMPFAIERINHDIETGRMREDAVVMMIGEGKGRLLDRPTLPDLSWFLQRWTIELILADGSHEHVAESLRGQGVTHVLYNRGYYDWVLRKTRTPIDEVAFAMFELERFLGDHATLVFRIKGIRVYELESTGR